MSNSTDIIKCINPDIQDPISKSVEYTFNSTDIHFDKDDNLIYRFPYSKDTYWTHFRYTCYNTANNNLEDLEISLELSTTDNYQYEIIKMQQLKSKKDYDTIWPIPSVYTFGTNASIYFKVKQPSDQSSIYRIIITLIGYLDLFPKVENYLLLSPRDMYQFIFCKDEEDNNSKSQGSIWNVEHYDYICNIINKACEIRLIKQY
jgi:hypothetical protein